MSIRVNQLPQTTNVGNADFTIVDQGGVTRIATLQTLFNAIAPQTTFNVSVSAALIASQNDYSPSGFQAGITNRLILTPPSGGGVITGIVAPGIDGWALMLVNNSSTDSITINHSDPGSVATNQFLCPDLSPAVLTPYSCSLIIYTVNRWRFV